MKFFAKIFAKLGQSTWILDQSARAAGSDYEMQTAAAIREMGKQADLDSKSRQTVD